MAWAVAMEGRSDLGAIVVLIEDREEAESIAAEIRRRGPRVLVRHYPDPAPAPAPAPVSRVRP